MWDKKLLTRKQIIIFAVLAVLIAIDFFLGLQGYISFELFSFSLITLVFIWITIPFLPLTGKTGLSIGGGILLFYLLALYKLFG